ncbi:hypothetical protein CLIB1423_11S04742 [[Candida] railenensis]|uniref:Uncharacterized protein n=1 Tax=[Candida] railenensis TaxID=45579 RepID=A0A9P0QQI9_9ASCO|nr:hypothetical protein CLIB1423_11S04742 [[Candida] railenensis]
MRIIQLAYAIGTAQAIWNTLYAFESGKAYLHLSNNDIIQLNFTLTGKDLSLVNDQQIETLTTSPSGSSVFLFNENLYAFNANEEDYDNEVLDLCGGGSLSLSQYVSESNSWEEISLNFSSIEDSSYYQYASYLTPMLSGATEMYIYGGLCNGTREVSNRLLSFNPETGVFANISTSTKPSQFYGAANINPDPQSQLVIGGQGEADNSWLSMFQLATWGFSTGWSFEKVAQSSSSSGTDTINSRKQALALPIFSQLANTSVATIADYFGTTAVLLLGGESSSTKSSSFISKLDTDSNSWTWTNVNSTFTSENVLGAATIFNTLIVVNGTAGADGNGQYTVNLYDTDSLELVKSLKENTQSSASSASTSTSTSSSSSSSGTSTSTKAILGTILPLSALGMVIGAAIFFLKRRKTNKEDEVEEYDYQIGNYFESSTLGSGRGGKFGTHHEKINFSQSHLPGNVNAVHFRTNNDTNSTLEEMSIDSWVRKRQEFEDSKKIGGGENYAYTNNANNFSASSETLSSAATVISMSDARNPFQETTKRQSEDSVQVSPILPVPPPPLAARLSSPSMVNKSVSLLKKSLSFNTTNSQYGKLKKKSSTLRLKTVPSRGPTLFDDEFDDESEDKELGKGAFGEEGEEIDDDDEMGQNDEESVDGNLDVQVLVSSKRRSVLRVVNPDFNDIQEDTEDEASLRQRVPSGGKEGDEI